ncbi:MAG: hypothetical protein ACRESZ_21985, partial [Methylococcales bacterium]
IHRYELRHSGLIFFLESYFLEFSIPQNQVYWLISQRIYLCKVTGDLFCLGAIRRFQIVFHTDG